MIQRVHKKRRLVRWTLKCFVDELSNEAFRVGGRDFVRHKHLQFLEIPGDRLVMKLRYSKEENMYWVSEGTYIQLHPVFFSA